MTSWWVVALTASSILHHHQAASVTAQGKFSRYEWQWRFPRGTRGLLPVDAGDDSLSRHVKIGGYEQVATWISLRLIVTRVNYRWRLFTRKAMLHTRHARLTSNEISQPGAEWRGIRTFSPKSPKSPNIRIDGFSSGNNRQNLLK